MDIAQQKQAIAASAVDAIRAELSPRLVVLVGSVARGYADSGSDIDIFVVDPEEPSLNRTVRSFVHEGEALKLELYTSDYLKELRGAAGANVVRELNRLRDARVLYDRDGVWPELKPTIEEVRRAFGQPEDAITSVEELLSASPGALTLGDFEDVVLRACLAAEALSVVLLSIGDVPVTYTKPKWTWLGLTRIGDGAMSDAFAAATLADVVAGRGQEFFEQAKRYGESVHALIPDEKRAADQELRRSLWLMDKHIRDSASLLKSGEMMALRSPLLMVAAFGMSALSRANGWVYKRLLDALSLRRRLGSSLEATLTRLLIPIEVLDREEAARRHNAAVDFYQRVLAKLGIDEPSD
jgi:predicted nucleotidyltransferase